MVIVDVRSGVRKEAVSESTRMAMTVSAATDTMPPLAVLTRKSSNVLGNASAERTRRPKERNTSMASAACGAAPAVGAMPMRPWDDGGW